ncbi:hypothetical protein Hanom_Chr01g00068461 [Helianthus anomalus]
MCNLCTWRIWSSSFGSCFRIRVARTGSTPTLFTAIELSCFIEMSKSAPPPPPPTTFFQHLFQRFVEENDFCIVTFIFYSSVYTVSNDWK